MTAPLCIRCGEGEAVRPMSLYPTGPDGLLQTREAPTDQPRWPK